VRDRNGKEDIRQAMIQSPTKSRAFLDDIWNNHWCGRDGPIPCPMNSSDFFRVGVRQVTCVRTKTTE
jgi:hypothetical protein